MKYLHLITSLSVLFLATSQAVANTQIVIEEEYIPGNAKPIPVSLSGFSGEALEVITFDLYVQGFTTTTPDQAQYLLSGSNSGNLVGRAQDRFNKATLVNKSYQGGSLRRQAHTFVDDFLAALQRQGLGTTKIAFKQDQGRHGEIFVSDFDGGNAQAITSDNEIVAAPAWVPRRLALYYTSYRLGNPDIYYHNLSSGERKVVARYSGLNTSAAVSPDGSKITMIISKGGSPDVYVANADGTGLQQLTRTPEDESSPCWSPDGQWIAYATRVRERRVLSKIPVNGGSPSVIRTDGASGPSEPDWSPDGQWLVFTAQMGGFQICVAPAAGGKATVLVGGEDPSWAPNSRTVIFVKRNGNRRTLSLLDVPTKQTKDITRVSGNNSQPSWAR